MQDEEPGRRAEIHETIEQFLDSRVLKLVLVALVIVSLIPMGRDVESALRPIFLVVFGAELIARYYLWRLRPRPDSSVRTFFGITDALAYVSFFPLEWVIGDESAHIIALLRLTRLLMLLR